MHIEQSLLAAFVKRNKRDRYREILANPRLRHKFISQLGHFTDFDPKYRVPIPGNKLFVNKIAIEWQKRHSPSIVFAISEDPALDQKELPLLDALNDTVGRGMGTVLSCIPGRLAFFETEDERFILERHDLLEKPEYVRFVIGRKVAMLSNVSFKRQRRLWSGIPSGAPMLTTLGSCEHGLTKTWRNQLLSDATSSAWASVGSRPTQPNTFRESGRWFKFLNATEST